MVHTLAFQLLRLFSRPEKRHEFPCSRHRSGVSVVFCCTPLLFIVQLRALQPSITHSRRLVIIRSRSIS